MRVGVRSALDEIVARCLEVDPADRFQTVAELAWALSSLGAPRGRDSAARISRVLDRQSLEPSSGPLRATVPPPLVHAVRRWSRRLRRAMTHAGAALASLLLLGIASVFVVLALRDVPDTNVLERSAAAPAVRPAPVAAAAEAAVAMAALPAATPPRDPAADAGTMRSGDGARTEKVRDPAPPVRE